MNASLTKGDWAKYPFLPAATRYIRTLDLKIDSLANPALKPILDRAESRVREALLTDPPQVSYLPYDDEVELVSFPVAVVIVAATADEFIKKRYALAEAKRVYDLLRQEDKFKLCEVARAFGWRMNVVSEGEDLEALKNYDLKLHFVDYLKNAQAFHEAGWKLVNRTILGGMVYLTIQESARLLQEEVRRHVEAKLKTDVRSVLPPNIAQLVENLRRIRESRFRNVKVDTFKIPKESVVEAYPPCIRRLYEIAASGGHLSHAGRFALTSFLLNTGMQPDKIVDLFRSSPDFNERMTRYQVEHIAGLRGSRTRYTPYACNTLKTHGLCPGGDDICQNVRHPLTYYWRKIRRRMAPEKTVVTAEQS